MVIGACRRQPARAEEDEAARASRWQDLKHAVFGDRTVQDGAGVIALDAPGRALDAAMVPITVTLPTRRGSRRPREGRLYALVDGNPSPLAGTFHFGPAADPRSLKTRVRVDQYSCIHAVAETEDGRLFAAERFVKAAGGCSAPSLKDPKLAMSRLGQMRLRVDSEVPAEDGKPAVAQLLISHPNNNGMQMDQLTHNFIPARYIQDIAVTLRWPIRAAGRRRHLAQRGPGDHLRLRPARAGAVQGRGEGQCAFGIHAGVSLVSRAELTVPERTPALSRSHCMETGSANRSRPRGNGRAS